MLKLPLKIAAKAGCSQSTISRINNRKIRFVSPELAARLVMAMEGALDPLDLYPEIKALSEAYNLFQQTKKSKNAK